MVDEFICDRRIFKLDIVFSFWPFRAISLESLESLVLFVSAFVSAFASAFAFALDFKFCLYRLCEIVTILGEEECTCDTGVEDHGVTAFLADRLNDRINFGEDRLKELFAFLQDGKFDLLLFGLQILLFLLQFFLAGLCGYLRSE